MRVITTAMLLLFALSSFAQTKEESLQWLRSHLNTLVIHYNDSILPYRMTKTYIFYEDVFVVKTVKDFYKDTSLNSHPAFSKIWYKDIFTESDTAVMNGIQREKKEGKVFVYTIWAEPVYGIIGSKDAPLSFWRTFNEPMGLDLYLSEEKTFSLEAIHKLYRLATLLGARQKPPETVLNDNLDED